MEFLCNWLVVNHGGILFLHLSDLLLTSASLLDSELCLQLIMFLKETYMKSGQKSVVLSEVDFSIQIYYQAVIRYL